MFKDSTFKMNKIAQTAVPISWLDQKNALSTLFVFLSWSWLSNFQIYFPSLSDSLHHLNPTKSLPVTFFTTQKSKELNTITNIKVMISEMKLPMTRYMMMAAALKAKVKMQAVGCAALLRSQLLEAIYPPTAASVELESRLDGSLTCSFAGGFYWLLLSGQSNLIPKFKSSWRSAILIV